MDEHIDMDNPLCRASWCSNFSCSDAELANAVHIMDNTAMGLVGLYLATLRSESCVVCKPPATCPPSPQQLTSFACEADHGRQPNCAYSGLVDHSFQ